MPNKLSQIWQELKDRRVIRTATVYVAVALGLMETIDIISGQLNFPGWVLTVYIFISAIGFMFIIPLSWIFYFGPDGIKRYKKHYAKYLPEPTEDNEGMLLFEIDSKYIEETTKPGTRSGKILGISSFTVICLVIVLFLFYSAESVHFNEKDLVVLADFVNHTEELIFDHSLNTALEISIDQSRHINVVPYKRMQEVLKRIGKESGTVIDEALCREIAIREGAKAYIIPEISKVGKQYILSGKLQETENGELINSMIYYCESRDEIIGALDRMSKRVRRHLGESRYKISGQSKPLAKVTTSSLDALKQYSRGNECMDIMDYENAVAHFRMAIGLDSSFTTAKASLGSLLCEYYDSVEGKKWLDEAIQSIDNLTNREKYGILGVYAVHVEKDLNKSMEYNRILIELYPERAGYRLNLGLDLFDQGRFKEAVTEFKHAVRLDPYEIGPYASLSYIYNSKLRQIDSAMYWAQRMISIGPENPWGHFYLGVCYFEIDELEKARYEFEKVREISPGIKVNLYNLAHTLIALEEFELAIDVFKNIEGAGAIYDLGLCYEVMGADKLAVIQYEKYLSILESEAPDTPINLIAKGIVLSRLGRKEEGMETGRRGFEQDSSLHYGFAQLLAVQQYPEQALHHLEKAFENGYWDLVEIKMNQELSSLKNDERFLRLMEQYLN
jgi:tetratricopeptide (TPR) repeat protein